jgi:nucleotide-binding universal stress UspA family protein
MGEEGDDMVRMGRILVPVDFSGPSDAAVEEAFFIARRFESQVDVMHVWRPRPNDEESLSMFARSDVGHEMRRYLERAEAEGIVARGRLAYGDPEALILEHAPEYDLIVMGTRGRGGVAHVIRPSVAEHVVRRATVPVLTIHSAGESAGAGEALATASV